MMTWARGRMANGTIVTGVISGDALHPRNGLGSDRGAGDPVALADLTLLAPVVPGKFIGLWNNYKAAAEKGGQAHPTHPLWFLKANTCLAGPGDQVVIPESAGRVIFEGELGIVIGQTCKSATEVEAEAAILGYTCVNDITSLDVLNADPSFAQWTRAKSFDGFGVIGPVIATGLDWASLVVKVMVDGRERQSYEAADMILTPPQIVRLLSQDLTLEPGDVIACGTSLGARPVKAGQVVEVVIDGIGSVGVTMAGPSGA
jgi:2-keto-4-pentenoate hydratase/2-oxohepta-3-ene-1,7-dioic acid hydratase in catechol pathway